MFSEVGKYALINAKLRARISKMLSEEFFSSLVKSPSLAEMLTLLKNSAYSDLPGIYEKTGDLKMVERSLYKRETVIFTELVPYLPAELLPLAEAYAAGYEIENLKNALRLFFDNRYRKRPVDDSIHYLMREQLINHIPFEAIINSSSLAEIAGHLSMTPYNEVVRKSAPEVERMQSLFPLTTALDRLYYRQLLDRVKQLSSRDRAVALHLIGIEIDLQNINWIIRFRSIYELSFDTVQNLIIPGGFTVRGNTLQDVYRSQQISAPLQAMLHKNYPGIATLLAQQTKNQNQRLSMIERILEQIMLEEVHRIMRGYPFTVGIVLAYYILRRLEIKRIRTVLNAGQYRINPERTASLL